MLPLSICEAMPNIHTVRPYHQGAMTHENL